MYYVVILFVSVGSQIDTDGNQNIILNTWNFLIHTVYHNIRDRRKQSAFYVKEYGQFAYKTFFIEFCFDKKFKATIFKNFVNAIHNFS